MQEFIDLFHDGAQNLVELQRGGEGLTKFMEDGNFAGLPLARVEGGIPATLDTAKALRLCQFEPRSPQVATETDEADPL